MDRRDAGPWPAAGSRTQRRAAKTMDDEVLRDVRDFWNRNAESEDERNRGRTRPYSVAFRLVK